MTEDDLRNALAEGEKSGVVESKERTMVEGVFYLGDRPSGAFMTHRSEIQWLDSKAGAEEIRAMARDHGAQGCFPVADGTLDEITGGAFLEDILQALGDGLSQGLKPLIKKVGFIPETMSALKAFEAFKRGETDYLFVMDEYGGFAGLLSVRDLIEEIVGQLSEDESEEEGILPQGDGTWLADGSANIDDIAAVLDLSSLTESHQDYHTLAGFILSFAGEIPKTAASFSYNGFILKIVDMDGNRIDKVLISRIQE
jgi:putative hemolysin